MSLRTATEAPPFELISLDEKPQSLEFNPELVEVHAPVQGAITEPCLPPAEIQDIDLPAAEHSSRQWWRVAFWPPNWGNGAKCLKMGALPPIQVVRPEDLLVLEFSFENVVLEKGKHDIPRLVVPKESTTPGIIKISFPPQSITEQAFYEINPDFPLKLEDGSCMPRKQAGEENCDVDASLPGSEDPTPPPVAARMSGTSQLMFSLPVGKHLEYTIEGLLNWTDLKPILVDYADGPPSGRSFQSSEIVDPRANPYRQRDFTALETPYRLFLSPNKYGAWKHITNSSATSEKRTELWHTRLAVKLNEADGESDGKIDEKSTEARTVRAIWSPDFHYSADPCNPPPWLDDQRPFRMSMNRSDRHEIVRLTSDYVIDEIDQCPTGVPAIAKGQHTAPVQVNRLMLSSLGAFMDTRGTWEPPKFMRVEEWVHRSTMARDHYVKVVYKGYLFPLGHRASLIKVTERKFKHVPGEGYVAYLRQRMFIVVRERVKHYPALGQPFSGRGFPFQRVEFCERDSVTPDLDEPKPINGEQKFYNFWPSIQGDCYQFRFIGWDEQGPKHLSAPLIFVDNIVAHNGNLLQPVISEYLSIEPRTPLPAAAPTIPTPSPTPNPARCAGATRTIAVNGQVIAYGSSKKSGDTGFPTDDIRLTVDQPFNPPALQEQFRSSDQPPFYPRFELAAIHVPAVEEFTGQLTVRDIQYPGVYLERGFDPSANAAEIFAEVMTGTDDLRKAEYREPLFLTFGGPAGDNGDRSGGLSTPNQRVIGLSRVIGLVGGSAAQSNGANTQARAMLANPGTSAFSVPSTSGIDTNPALQKALNGEFDPFEFFGGAVSDAKLLGVVKLSEIIKVVLENAIGNLGDAPQMLRNTLYNLQGVTKPIIRQLIGAVGGIDGALSSAPPELKQRLQPAWQDLRNAVKRLEEVLAKLDGPDPAKAAIEAIAVQAQAVQAIKRLLDECKRLATDPLGALGFDPKQLTAKLLALVGGLGPILDAKELLRSIRAEVENALAGFLSAVNDASSNLNEEARVYLRKVHEEINTVKGRVDKSLDELVLQLANISDLANKNLEKVLALTSQFNKDVNNLKNQYAQLMAAIRTQTIPIEGPLNELLKLGLIDAQTTAAGLALQFQQARAELEQKWNALPAEIQNEAKTLYQETKTLFREVQDLPDSEHKKGLSVLNSYTERINVGWLTSQQEFLRVLSKLDELLAKFPTVTGGPRSHAFNESMNRSGPRSVQQPSSLASEAVTVEDLKKTLADIGKKFTIVGKYFADPAAAQSQLDAVANQLVGKLRDDVLKVGNELMALLVDPQQADPFLANAVKVNEKLNLIRDRATYGLLMAGGKISNVSTAFQSAFGRLQAQLQSYEARVRTEAGTLRVAVETFQNQVPDILRPAVAGLLVNLLASLQEFESGARKLEELPVLLQDLLQLRDRIVSLITNPIDQLPKLLDLQKLTDEFLKQFGIPAKIALSFDWKPPLKNPSWKIFEIDAGDPTEFIIRADAIIDVLKPAPPAFNITGTLTNFKLNLLPDLEFIVLTFKRLEFKSLSGGPLKVDAQIASITFGNALEFVKELAAILNPSSGPFLDIQPSGITAGFRFGWPMISVGSMIMYGLSVYTGVTLPFDGTPLRLRLGVSDRARPFLLAVGVYAGGGFLGIELDALGIQKVEGALEFGAHVELDFFGIAKGHGSVMGGFYFSSDRKYKPSGEAYVEAKLCGYVRASGELSILGLITQSLDIYVQVCWQSNPNRVYGSATITVEISMLFFSVSVDVTAEYTFLGSENPSHHHHAEPAISDATQNALPAADETATRGPIYADAFRWDEFLAAFHD